MLARGWNRLANLYVGTAVSTAKINIGINTTANCIILITN
jgi:hypothetical protein